MKRSRPVAALAAWIFLGCGLGCTMLPIQLLSSEEPRRSASSEEQAEERARRSDERAKAQKEAEESRAAERAAREQAIIDGIVKLRAEIASGGEGKSEKAIAFAKLVMDAAGTSAAKEGRLVIDELSPEAASYLDKAIAAAPSMQLFDALLGLPSATGIDAAVLRACARVRPTVSNADLADFVGECLERADSDPKQLKWAGAAHDIEIYKQVEEAKRSAEAAAKQAKAKLMRYVAAAVFASGRCNFSDCLKNGWTTSTPEGDIEVRCDFQDCFKNGWTARFPDGSEARTRCNFQDCTKNGWETSYPDGEASTTRCSFQDCLKDGWDTDLPGGQSARTRCSFQDCSTNGWETDLPDGEHQQCRCNFQKCFENGASCG